MSIPYSGTIRRSAGVISAISKQIRFINLKGVKRITFTFDPFSENIKHTREFLFHLTSPKVFETNSNCVVRTNIVCDRAPPLINFTLIPAVQETAKLKDIKFNAENLTTLELLQLCNKYITKLAPKEEIVQVIATKSAKKASGVSLSRKKK